MHVEHVVVVGVGHRVVEAELLARLDVAHRDEQHRADDAAVRIARVVDVVGRIERRRAREEQVVVDLQGVDAHRFAEALRAPGRRRRGRRTRRRSCSPGSRRARTRRYPSSPSGACSRSDEATTAARTRNVPVVTETTVFEVVGGQPFFDALVERFYARVEADPTLRPLYPADLGPGMRALALFLGQYWGGPPTYSAEKGHPRLRMRHAPVRHRRAASATPGSRRCSPRSTRRTHPRSPGR